ncbi:MAG: hypothetical protein RMK16_09050 [Acidobacteriota bacterium]|nr:hypothetical protein [Acidobacteriota bacterium]
MAVPFRWKAAVSSFGIFMLTLVGPWGTGSLSSHRLVISSWIQHPYWMDGPEWAVYRVDHEGQPRLWHVLQWQVDPSERYIGLRHWQMPTLADGPTLTYEGRWDGDRLDMAWETTRADGPGPSAWVLWALVRLLPIDPTQETTRTLMKDYRVTRVDGDAEAWTFRVGGRPRRPGLDISFGPSVSVRDPGSPRGRMGLVLSRSLPGPPGRRG